MMDLDRLSLLAHVEISNRFTGFFMTPQLRKWNLRAWVNLSPRLQFELTGQELGPLISEALQKVTAYYQEAGREMYLDERDTN